MPRVKIFTEPPPRTYLPAYSASGADSRDVSGWCCTGGERVHLEAPHAGPIISRHHHLKLDESKRAGDDHSMQGARTMNVWLLRDGI
jgi:hypothetical protein